MLAFVYDLIHVLPLCLVVVLAAFSNIGSPLIYVLSIVFSIIPVLFMHLKNRARMIMLGMTGMALLGTLIAIRDQQRETLFHDYVWILWVLLICMACLLIESILARYRKAKIVFVLAGFLVLLVMLFRSIAVDKCIILMFFLYAVLTLIEEFQLRWHKEGGTELKAHLVYVFPFVAALFIALFLIKPPAKPYDWKFVKDFAKAARIRYEIIVQTIDRNRSWDNDEAKIGFSDKSSMSAELSSAPYKVLDITQNTVGKGSLYLAGKSFDTFDGRRWSKNDSSDIDYKTYDALETLSAVLDYDPEYISDYIKNEYIYIECVGVRTAHTFMPGKALSKIDGADVRQIGGDVSFAGRKKLLYKVRYFRLNRNYEGFDKLLSKRHVLDESSLDRAKAELTEEDMSEYTVAEYNRYRQNIYDVYCPKTDISEKMRKKLDEVVSPAESDYQKLTRIEEFLLEFEYTTSPGELPESVQSPSDFADYLIFDKKSGYCTHFATAFVILARAEGIPARYVQGYDVISTERKCEVMSDRAHAWAEAYIDGFGWISFEPTPGFKKNIGWTIGDRTVPDRTDYYNELYKNGVPHDEMEDLADLDDEETKRSFDPKVILLPAVMAAVFVILFLIADLLYKKIRYSHMSDREKVMNLWTRNIRLLKRAGLKLEEGETISEFEIRAGKTVTQDLITFLAIYEKIIYAGKEAGHSDTLVFEKNNAGLKRFVIEQRLKRRRK